MHCWAAGHGLAAELACPRSVHQLPQINAAATAQAEQQLIQQLLQYWLERQPGVWQLLGDACARGAAQDVGALPALLHAVLQLTKG